MLLILFALFSLFVPTPLRAQAKAIDAARSVLTVHVSKSGVFSAFAHNHEIEAPIAEGAVTPSGSASVSLRVDARKLHVLDPGVSTDDRAKIQATMEGPAVLDSARFPEIAFQSTSTEPAGADHWTVRGNLTLHGQTHPVTVSVNLKNGHYVGSATVSQRDFGIAPISLAGGSVKVKDAVEIDFDIVLAP